MTLWSRKQLNYSKVVIRMCTKVLFQPIYILIVLKSMLPTMFFRFSTFVTVSVKKATKNVKLRF